MRTKTPDSSRSAIVERAITESLWVVMPAYNEEEALPLVVREWMPVLRETGADITLCILNDGSKDHTLAVSRSLANEFPEIRVVDKVNSGHGQTCVEGYRLALLGGAHWVFQMDSDGQCDSAYFPSFWTERSEHTVVYGNRVVRLDGFRRRLISKVVSCFVLAATGTWITDPNVPYRLMHVSTLSPIVGSIPQDFYLANILLAVMHKQRFTIQWKPIVFRLRLGGTPSVRTGAFFDHGIRLFRQLRSFTQNVPQQSLAEYRRSEQIET
jgi:glycosyltransferase involved in cell wall biosynthesis